LEAPGATADLVQAKDSLEARASDLARTVSMLRTTLESTSDAILVTGPDGEIVERNGKLAQVWGIAREKMLQLDSSELWSALARQTADANAFVGRVAEIAGSGLDSYDAIELLDGRVIERSSTVEALDEAIAGRVWSFRDVTERKFHEAALRSSHA